MKINGTTIPTTMAGVGKLYKWNRAPIVAKNGRGRVVEAGYASLQWGWTWLSDSDWDWWVTTILAGARDALLTGDTELYDDDKVLRDITSCIVNRPIHETIVNGVHYNVQILIEQIVLA